MARLQIIDGRFIGESFELPGDTRTIGRNNDNDIVLNDERVSRHHCRIDFDGPVALIQDLDSSNGTYVNGIAVTAARLYSGDEIRVGGHLLEFAAQGESRRESDVVIIPSETDLDKGTVEIVVPEDSTEFFEEHIANSHSPERLLRDLALVYQVGNLVNGVRDHDSLLKTILNMAFDAVEASRGFLVLIEEGGGLIVKARRLEGGKPSEGLLISHAIADGVLKRGQGILTNDALHDERFSQHDSIITNHLRSVLCVPLKCKDRILGFIYLDNPLITCAFSTDDLRLVTAVAIQAAAAMENSRLFKAIEDLMFGSIGALVATVEAKDRYLRGHSERVARICRAMGREMGLTYERMKVLQLASLLHDIGKIGISEAILHKKERLTDDEIDQVHEHSERGAEILVNIHDMTEVALAVRHHHEFFNGNGYPDGIAGENVPLQSRIITVADSYDAMTSNRPYRKKLDQDACIAEIVRCSGSQFDPEAVEALLKCVRKSRILGSPQSN
jgi:putative nucleotidyltransferase with HDIG domain